MAGSGPARSIPSARSRSSTGEISSISSRPMRPPSPACGFSPATAIRGCAMPNRAISAAWVMRRRFSSSSAVSASSDADRSSDALRALSSASARSCRHRGAGGMVAQSGPWMNLSNMDPTAVKELLGYIGNPDVRGRMHMQLQQHVLQLRVARPRLARASWDPRVNGQAERPLWALRGRLLPSSSSESFFSLPSSLFTPFAVFLAGWYRVGFSSN